MVYLKLIYTLFLKIFRIKFTDHRKDTFICFANTIQDRNGEPYGFIWLTACFTYRNYRMFPIGWYRSKK